MGVGQMKMVKLIEIIQSQDTDGHNQETEGPSYPLWANIQRKGSGVDYKSGVVNLTESLEFTTYFRFDFKPDSKYKVLYLGNRHQVKSVQRQNERKYYWIIKADAAHD